jgi:hypothetical protein
MLRAPPVLLLLVVLAGLAGPPGARAQDVDEAVPALPSKGFRLEQNYPHPANPDTYIPFYLEEELFSDGEPRVVSIRIMNMFRQLVAVPTAVGHPRGRGVPVENLRFTDAGRKVAYWDGRNMDGERVPSGIYFCELQIGDRVDYSRIIVTAPRRRSRIFPFFRRNE